jgi:G3E family GTPase
MNELGQMDIDGHILQDTLKGLSLEKLLDGCICCDKKSEVAASIEQLIRTAPDLVIIELTGVANPEEIADCLTAPMLMNRVRLKQIVTVLDAELVLDYNSIFSSDRSLVHTLRRQMEVADILLVNKTDLVTSSRLVKIEKAIRKQNAATPIFNTTQSQMNMESLLSDITPNRNESTTKSSPFSMSKGQPRSGNDHTHPSRTENRSYSRLVTITLPSKTKVNPKHVERFIKDLGSRLLRAKGYLKLQGDDSRAHLVQLAGNRIGWLPTTYTGDNYLVLIGLELDTERIQMDWEQMLFV